MESSDDEEEEIIAYADFEDGTVDREMLLIPNVKFKIIGLDTDTPIVQLRDFTFKGTWNDTLGTKLLFEEDPTPEQVDTTFTVTPETMLRYKCQTTKTLDLSRVILKPKSNFKLEDLSENDRNIEANTESNPASSECLTNVIDSTTKPDSSVDHLMKKIVKSALNE